MTNTIYSICNDMTALMELLDEKDGIVEQESLDAFNAFEAEIQTDFVNKLDSYAAVIQEFEMRSDNRKTEARRMSELAKKDEERADMLRRRLFALFQNNNWQPVETSRFKIGLMVNGGKRKLQIHIDDEQIPNEYVEVIRVNNTEAIRSALESGTELGWASLAERTKRLSIR
tara:strand:+ start:36 stop:551 length:516 start_codon:yes stop_codon:yes gene_type:complete